MRSVFQPKSREELKARLAALRPDSPRRWGRMTPHQAVCHLSDSFRAALGDRPVTPRPPGPGRRVIGWMAFNLPFPWPHGVRTSKELDAERDGTPPGDFDEDVAELESLIDRFADSAGALPPHYVWGDLTRGEWGRYGYRHVDHHLRQFGV